MSTYIIGNMSDREFLISEIMRISNYNYGELSSKNERQLIKIYKKETKND